MTFAVAAGDGVAGHEIALGLGASETVADITGLLSGTAVGMAAGFGANAVDKHFNLSGYHNLPPQEPKVYSADGDPDLRATRRPAFNDMRENGVNVNGEKYTLSDHGYNKLFSSGRKDIMPIDIIDALSSTPLPAESGTVMYTNPATGTTIFVNPETNVITGIWPKGFII